MERICADIDNDICENTPCPHHLRYVFLSVS